MPSSKLRRPVQRFLLAACLFVCVAPFARALQSAPPAAPADANDVALTIDGHDVSVAEFGEWMLGCLGVDMADEYAFGTYLIGREARRMGVDVTDADVAARVQAQLDERIAGAFHGVKDEWLAELQRTERTEPGLRRQRLTEVLPELQARALAAIDRVVPKEKIEREWWLRYGRHGLKHDLLMMKFGVIVESANGATRDELKAEETKQKAARLADARAVRARIVAGADFGQLAQENSTDEGTRANRGRPPGGFDHQGWPPAFLDALEALQIGQLSEPLYARGGWWLVLVRGRTETPLAKVRDALAADLITRGPEDDEVELVRQRVRAGVQVEILPGLEHPDVDAELEGPLVPALSIDGERVSRGTYARWLVRMRGEVYARNFAEEWLLKRKAAAAGIRVTEAEIHERALDVVRQIVDMEHGRDRERWLAMLANSGRTEADFIRGVEWRLRSNLLAEKLILAERKVTEADIRTAYVAAYGQDGERREVSYIALSSRPEEVPQDAGDEARQRALAAAQEKTRVKAQSLADQARAGADFAALARANSDHMASRVNGGKLEGRFDVERFTPDIGAAVAKLAVGGVTDPVEWGPTWYVLRLDALRKVTFDDVHDELAQQLRVRRPTLIEVLSYRNALGKPVPIRVRAGMWQ